MTQTVPPVHMEAADMDNADIWLMQMMYPVVSEVATELQTLIT